MINFLLHVLNPQNMEQNQWISCSFFQEGYDEINLSIGQEHAFGRLCCLEIMELI